MVENDERRLVASRLRDIDTSEVMFDSDLVEAIGLAIFKKLKNWDYEDIICTIAELIDPDDHFADTGKKVDREALLELADELEKCAWYFGLDFDADEPLRDRLKEASEDFAGCARRIREACGVEP